MAEIDVATPRKMKPIPIQMASRRIALSGSVPKCRKHSTAKTSEAAPLMNESTRPPAETCRLNAKKTCAAPVTSR